MFANRAGVTDSRPQRSTLGHGRRSTGRPPRRCLTNGCQRPTKTVLRRPLESAQYASVDYQQLLKAWNLTVSMSRVANCWDNAMMESFFGTFKTELIHHEQFATRGQATSRIIAWIEGWYNRRRRHSAIGYKSPEQFEAELN